MSWNPHVWTEAVLIPIAGDWGYAVGLLDTGAIRIAKGKISAAKPDRGCPISQGNKVNLNLKDRALWEQIKAEVDRLFEEAADETD